jgi:hypothetical protein
VGTSFTGYRGDGFWTRDPARETVLALLVLDLEPVARENGSLAEILDTWTVQAMAGFGGCVSPDVDEHLSRQPGMGPATPAREPRPIRRLSHRSLKIDRPVALTALLTENATEQ